MHGNDETLKIMLPKLSNLYQTEKFEDKKLSILYRDTLHLRKTNICRKRPTQKFTYTSRGLFKSENFPIM